MDLVRGVPEHPDARDSRRRLLEQLDSLFGQLTTEIPDSCHVPSRPREARDEPSLDGIRRVHGHDRRGCRGLLGRDGCLGIPGHDDVGLESEHLREQTGYVVDRPVATSLHQEVSARHIAELAQAPNEASLPAVTGHAGRPAATRTTLATGWATPTSGAARRPPVTAPRNTRRSTTRSPD